ncbi:deoxyguanosinetriphosphate triphosphohydrolase [Actinomyces minihominis]|uniref:deoxyguanosinetriphosphate triphosphohydrolase n=1 Tax=Actinomyces minihominis TaxID=2002838 RepID=UPI000C081C0B|nr:deoxyguanosinetriphosphate triphosphohydrolase [Actinomyces minihominis]
MVDERDYDAQNIDFSQTEWPYDRADRGRFLPEDPKDPRRSPFDRDRARILHSAGLRRLGTKTQVLGPGSDDFVRTRLTHSLEVAQVGRGLALELGCDPDVVDAACLAHDLGHPPFGHNGERALDEVAADIGGFEGNAQTFRLVARLETKVMGPNGVPGGLNLTRATLDAITKYPWVKGGGPDPQKSLRKWGCYEDDAEVFDWMREGAPAGRRCLEAQVMDLSDDIGYSVHDLEDAVATGHFALERLRGEVGELEAIIQSTVDWYSDAISEDELGDAADRLFGLDYWPTSYDGSYRARAEIKDLTSQLIGRFCSAAVAATRAEYGAGPLGRFGADLVIPKETEAEIGLLKGIAVHYVMSPRESQPVYYQQRTIVHDLVTALFEGGPGELELPFAEEWERASDDAGRLRAVIDQVACLTDVSANAWHARLCGLLSTLL